MLFREKKTEKKETVTVKKEEPAATTTALDSNFAFELREVTAPTGEFVLFDPKEETPISLHEAVLQCANKLYELSRRVEALEAEK